MLLCSACRSSYARGLVSIEYSDLSHRNWLETDGSLGDPLYKSMWRGCQHQWACSAGIWCKFPKSHWWLASSNWEWAINFSVNWSEILLGICIHAHRNFSGFSSKPQECHSEFMLILDCTHGCSRTNHIRIGLIPECVWGSGFVRVVRPKVVTAVDFSIQVKRTSPCSLCFLVLTLKQIRSSLSLFKLQQHLF